MKAFLFSLGFLFASFISLDNCYAEETGDANHSFGGFSSATQAADGNAGSSSGGSSSSSQGGSKGAQKKGGGENKVPEAIAKFVAPTSSFGMGGLCVGQSCALELGTGTQNDVVWRAIRVIARIAGTVAILFYIIAAFFLITAQDENGLGKGKTLIIYTSLGLVLIFTAYIIVQFVLALIFSV